MKKVLDAVKMIRKIRDELHAQTKHMTPKERIEFYRQGAKDVYGELGRKKYLSKAH